ncbi:hypothetical protein AZE42_06175 [Rhizopogon vesiculosus]|uniref:Uncharacterized protein n=1 Tax=Rhizopogon vesiculosus TaxID=180088 RepID=A0A1J8R2T8_9AGAM|nr:hypothetical protein AZE42_06175 [Rhizopogon vesiculosus]
MPLSPAGISFGPLLVGFALNTILYGGLVTSVLIYFSSFKSDGAWIRLLDAQFKQDAIGDQDVLSRATWVFSLLPGITGIVTTLVQLFFAWRIHVLTSSVWLVGIIAFLASAALLCGIGTTVAINMVPVFTQFHKFEVVFVIGLASSAMDNLLITGLLVYSLREHKTGFIDTDDIIKKIIRVTLQTALTDGMHLVFNQSLAKFYTISLMSTLVARPRDYPYTDFTVVNGPQQSERRIDRRRTSDLVFDTVSLKKFDTITGATDNRVVI